MNTALNPNNYPTYNIGDKVTIRQWEDMESEFGLNEFGDIKVPKFFFHKGHETILWADIPHCSYRPLCEICTFNV